MIKIVTAHWLGHRHFYLKSLFDNSYFLELRKKFNIIIVPKENDKFLNIITPFHCSLFSLKDLKK